MRQGTTVVSITVTLRSRDQLVIQGRGTVVCIRLHQITRHELCDDSKSDRRYKMCTVTWKLLIKLWLLQRPLFPDMIKEHARAEAFRLRSSFHLCESDLAIFFLHSLFSLQHHRFPGPGSEHPQSETHLYSDFLYSETVFSSDNLFQHRPSG